MLYSVFGQHYYYYYYARVNVHMPSIFIYSAILRHVKICIDWSACIYVKHVLFYYLLIYACIHTQKCKVRCQLNIELNCVYA